MSDNIPIASPVLPDTKHKLKISKSVTKYSLLLLMVIFGIFSIANSALAVEYYNLQDDYMKAYTKDFQIMSIVNLTLTLIAAIYFVLYYGLYCHYYPENTSNILARILSILIIIVVGVLSSVVNLKIFSRLSCRCPVQNKDNKLLLCYITYFIHIPIWLLIIILFYFYTKKNKVN